MEIQLGWSECRSAGGRRGSVHKAGFSEAASARELGARHPNASHRGRLLSIGVTDGSPTLFCSSFATGGGITGKIAEKLGLDVVLEEAEDAAARLQPSPDPRAQEIVRSCFRRANRAVYDYAHQMGAGGSMGASLVIAVLDGTTLSAGRVGPFEGYLFRQGRTLPLFGERWSGGEGTLSRFVGANAKILVDIASVELEAGDLVILRDESDPIQLAPLAILNPVLVAQTASARPSRLTPLDLVTVLEQHGSSEHVAETLICVVG